MQRTIGTIIAAALVTGGALLAQGRAARSTTPDDPAYSLEARDRDRRAPHLLGPLGGWQRLQTHR